MYPGSSYPTLSEGTRIPKPPWSPTPYPTAQKPSVSRVPATVHYSASGPSPPPRVPGAEEGAPAGRGAPSPARPWPYPSAPLGVPVHVPGAQAPAASGPPHRPEAGRTRQGRGTGDLRALGTLGPLGPALRGGARRRGGGPGARGREAPSGSAGRGHLGQLGPTGEAPAQTLSNTAPPGLGRRRAEPVKVACAPATLPPRRRRHVFRETTLAPATPLDNGRAWKRE